MADTIADISEDAVSWLRTLDQAYADAAIATVIERVVAVLRADPRMPRLTCETWRLIFADVESRSRAELGGSDVAFALGINVQGHAPVLDLCRRLVAAGIERDERRARTVLGGSVANLHSLIASPRDGWMTWGNEIPRERFEGAAE